MNIEEAKEQLISLQQNAKANIDTDEIFKLDYEAIETVLNLMEKQQKEITDMREIFIRTAKHQEKLGHIQLADYMLAQIEATPTFTTWEEYKTWVSKDKIREIIKELDIDIEINKRRKISNDTDGNLSMILIRYDPEIVKMRLLKLLEEN